MQASTFQEVVLLEYLEKRSPRPIRVVILVLSAFAEPWSSWQKDGQDKTFLSEIPDGVAALRYSGQARERRLKFRISIFLKRMQHKLQQFGSLGSMRFLSEILKFISSSRFGDTTITSVKDSATKSVFVKGPSAFSKIDVISTPVPSNPELIGLSTIEAFNFVLENYDFEYIFRTNSSSYVNLHKLYKLTETLPKTGVYAGYKGRILRTIAFASGAGYLISRDVVEKICSRQSLWRHGLIDDVALAELLTELFPGGIEQIPLPRRTIENLEEAKSLSQSDINSNFHYRCKTDSTFETVDIMREIHQVESTYKSKK